MKSALTYAIVIALSVFLFVSLALTINELAGFQHTFLDYMVLGLVVLTGTFLIVRRFFIRFVEIKIDPIFKTIQSYSVSELCHYKIKKKTSI